MKTHRICLVAIFFCLLFALPCSLFTLSPSPAFAGTYSDQHPGGAFTGLAGPAGHCTSAAGIFGYNVSTAPPQYTITVTTPSNGAITLGTTTVNSGNSLQFTITPATRYQLISITDNGVPVGGWIPGAYLNFYTINNIGAVHTIAAIFGPVVPTIFNASTAGTIKNLGTAGNVGNMQ